MKGIDPGPGLELMDARSVPTRAPLFWASVAVEIGAGGALIFGYRAAQAAILLAAYTLVVNFALHAFWTMPEELAEAQFQLFVKNLAVIGGLIVVASVYNFSVYGVSTRADAPGQ